MLEEFNKSVGLSRVY